MMNGKANLRANAWPALSNQENISKLKQSSLRPRFLEAETGLLVD